MKTYIIRWDKIILIPIIIFFVTVGFKTIINTTENTAATANQVDGYIIFVQCKPVAVYESLGEVKIKMTVTGSPKEIFNQVLKKVKKDFPKADAILFEGIEMDKATAIKFK